MTDPLADRLLAAIRSKRGRQYSFVELSRKLKCEQVSLTEALAQLKEWGYRIKVTKSKQTLCFLSAPDLLTSTEISYNLKAKLIGRNVVAYRKLKSTNDIAAKLAREGAAEGTIVTSEEQTAGKGRLGRSWYSPPGVGIYLSIILRPSFKPEQAPGISLMTGLALAETVSEYLPGQTEIKWPNDLLVCSKKAAGILTELSAERGQIDYLIVGVGINVNQTSGMFPNDIKQRATSIRRTYRKKVNRVELLQKFLSRFEKEYLLYKKYQLSKSRRRLLKYSSLLGQEITASTGKNELSGKAVDIDKDGALIVETESGKLKLQAGEVTLRKEAS